jgi:hypothetical protein
VQPDVYVVRFVDGERPAYPYEARNVSCWRGRDDPGEVFSKEIGWNPDGTTTPFVLDLAEFFVEACS